jgi:hypothetical protein
VLALPGPGNVDVREIAGGQTFAAAAASEIRCGGPCVG